jgi:aspartyl protease family protein
LFSRFVTAALLRACILWSLPAFAVGDLRGELEALAAQSGFSIEGLARIGPEPAGPAEGAPAERLKALLQDYNYLVVQSRPGAIEKVLITSRKAADGAKSADRAYVETTRLGTHHQVQATLAGPNAVAKTVPLLVDTGASSVVLPESMIEELGFSPEALRGGVSQTASGTVPVKIGVLNSVRVGAVAASDVEVGFIADRQLNGALLLGMSFLSRFRLTIDDARNELILLAK